MAVGGHDTKARDPRLDEQGLNNIVVPRAAIQILLGGRNRAFRKTVGSRVIHEPVGLLKDIHVRQAGAREFVGKPAIAKAKVFPVVGLALELNLFFGQEK